MGRRVALNVFAAAMAAFLVLPIFAVVPAAFSAQSFIRLPPEDWSLRWWRTFLADPSWRRALLASLEIATMTAALSVVLGTAAALGLQRLGAKARAAATGLLVGPAVVPTIVLAVALYAVARAAGLVGTTTGLVLAHTMLALPYAALNAGVSLAALDQRLLLAAAGLGAGPARVFATVTLPLILPGVIGAGVFAFVTSFDEVVLAIFLCGPQVKTLPVRIWEEIRVEYTPVVAVAATAMLALALAAAFAARFAVRTR
jgi:putative spermidine/putrescine transport system permease protein